MESVSERRAAQCVAVFYLVVSCFLFLLLVTLHIWSDFITSGGRNQDGFTWYFLILSAIFTILGISLSLILVKATSSTVEPIEGLRLTKTWIHFNFIFFVLGVISLVFSEMNASNVIGLVLQLLFIMIVYEYKRELQERVDETEPQVKFDSQVEETV